MKKSRNIFIVLTVSMIHFFKVVTWSLWMLVSGEKSKIVGGRFPFLDEIFEKGPKAFYLRPTAIRLGRAIFFPILYLISQKKHDKNQ